MSRKNCPKFLISKKFALQYTKILKNKEISSLMNFKFDNTEIHSKFINSETLAEKKDYIKVSELTWRLLEELYDAKPELSEEEFLQKNYPKSSKPPLHSNEPKTKTESNKKQELSSKAKKLSSAEKMKIAEKLVKEEQKTNYQNHEQETIPNSKPNPNGAPGKLSPVGLVNRSTHCFANSGLQCLLTNQEFSNYFLTSSFNSQKGSTIKSKNVSLHFAKFLKEMSQIDTRSYYDHSEMRSLVSRRFDPHMHHDCQEFIRFFLSELQDELNSKPPKNYTLEDLKSSSLAKEKYFSAHTSIIDQTFAGLLKSQVKCLNCKNVSVTYDPFLDLSLHFKKSGSRKIETMLDEFFSNEQVNGYACEKCKKRSKAIKSTSIAHLPPVLMIHLMRISMAPKKQKINDMIQYEINNFSLKKYNFILNLVI